MGRSRPLTPIFYKRYTSPAVLVSGQIGKSTHHRHHAFDQGENTLSTSAPSAVVCRRTLLFALLAATTDITEAQAATRADDLVALAKRLTPDEAVSIALDLNGSRRAPTSATAGRIRQFGDIALGDSSGQQMRALQIGSWTLRFLVFDETKLRDCILTYRASFRGLGVELPQFSRHAAEQLKLLAA